MNIHSTAGLFRLRFIFVFAACAFIFAPVPAPSQDPEYLAEYKLYNRALEDGDAEAAARHALAAWQAAEAALGDHRLTGTLAYNYGRLVLIRDSDAALPALQRAKELFDAGVAELPADELHAYVAYAEFVTGRQSRNLANALRDALEAYDNNGYENPDVAAMWLRLAENDLNDNRYDLARNSAEAAEAAIAVSRPTDYRAEAHALMIIGAATLLPRPRSKNKILAANDYFMRAFSLFPAQKNIDEFDPILSQIIGWNKAALSAYITELGVYLTDEEIDAFIDIDPQQSIPKEKSPADCEIEWAKSDMPNYPGRAAHRGYVGAVVVGYNLGNDTLLHDVRILSEIPSETFAKSVLGIMSQWRLKKPPLDHPDCRRNFIYTFVFSLKY